MTTRQRDKPRKKAKSKAQKSDWNPGRSDADSRGTRMVTYAGLGHDPFRCAGGVPYETVKATHMPSIVQPSPDSCRSSNVKHMTLPPSVGVEAHPKNLSNISFGFTRSVVLWSFASTEVKVWQRTVTVVVRAGSDPEKPSTFKFKLDAGRHMLPHETKYVVSFHAPWVEGEDSERPPTAPFQENRSGLVPLEIGENARSGRIPANAVDVHPINALVVKSNETHNRLVDAPALPYECIPKVPSCRRMVCNM
ncbi:hypothetical protein K474DRAFT_1676517 [Panus rudis PR-1116 ss-1]|nr:hypothetical protein K474DRAFT_1676517 [Panus rudis PR-1116 ss-1]